MSSQRQDDIRVDEDLNCWQSLANAIVEQAAKDYRFALRHLKEYPYSQKLLKLKQDSEEFFASRWYGILTRVNPNYILKRITEEEVA